jgi:hypothetical protein
MTINQDVTLRIKDYRVTIPSDQFAAMQQVLTQAAKAGQSPHPFQFVPDLRSLVLVVWGLDLLANRPDHALTELHMSATTSLQTFDTFLSLIAPFIAMNKPAYFDVLCEAEEGDREFFYHFESGKVIKEERVTIYMPAELEIRPPKNADHESL